MKVRDVMTHEIVSVEPGTTIREVAGVLLRARVSAVPVIDKNDKLVGIVSEGDLLNRPESDTRHPKSFWKKLWASPEQQSEDFRHAYGRTAGHVMSSPVVTVSEQEGLAEVAALFEKHRIKRAPVVRDQRVVGIVSRSDLLRPLMARAPKVIDYPLSHGEILDRLSRRLNEAGVATSLLRTQIDNDVLQVTGLVSSQREITDTQIAVEDVVGDSMRSVLQLTVRSDFRENL